MLRRLRITGPDGVERDASLGMELGPLWATWWLDVSAEVPEAWAGERVDLLLVTNSEATVWVDGEPVQGLVSGAGRDRIAATLVPATPASAARVEIACNGLFGWAELNPPSHRPEPIPPAFRLERCEIARFDPDAWALACDLGVLAALMDEADGAWGGELLRELNRFCTTGDRTILTRLLERRNGTRMHEITAIGHAHIDTAWLWPLEETYRKCVRTFASQLRLMERYPDYRFACSQAQQYAWIRDREPGSTRGSRARARGQWLPVGGTWIEPDCNLPPGESLVRQFLYGQRFFEQEFGRRAEVFWNPDVFGYNGQLPQLMRGAGISGFLTQKLSWNRYTTPDHHTFRWVGIDGSAVLAHFPPADTYNAEATVPELRRAARDFKDHERSAHSLWSSAGATAAAGRPPRCWRRWRGVEDLQGVPRTTIGEPEAFFERAGGGGRVAGGRRRALLRVPPRHLHEPGAHQAREPPRRAGAARRRAAGGGGRREPAGLDEAWQTLLLNHFHDILPGSSIGEVHARAERDLAEVEAAAGAVRDRLLPRGVVNTVGVGAAGGGRGAAASPRRRRAGSGVRRPSGRSPSTRRRRLHLDNGILRAVLGRDGTLRSLVVGGREAMAAPGNVLELYDDRPTDFEAWDLDPFHLETRADCPPAESAEVVLADPLRVEVAFERPIGARSRMRQTVRLDAEAGGSSSTARSTGRRTGRR